MKAGSLMFLRLASIVLSMSAGILYPFQASLAQMSNLKRIEVKGNGLVLLEFDSYVPESRIRTDYINEIVQLTFEGASIYPAKIIPVKGNILAKIFAYQYSPQVVRCRFSVKGKAENFRKGITLLSRGRQVRVEFTASSPGKQPELTLAPPTEDAQEAALLKKVIESEKKSSDTSLQSRNPEDRGLGANPSSKDSSKVLLRGLSKDLLKDSPKETSLSSENPSEQKNLAGGKPLPSIWNAFAKMMGLLLLLVCALVGIRKIQLLIRRNGSGNLLGKRRRSGGLIGRISGLIQREIKGEGKLIEVVSTHYLDQKKYIALVKVKGRLLVLGISNDSISLITQVANGAPPALTSDSEGLDPDGLQGGLPDGLNEGLPERDNFSKFLLSADKSSNSDSILSSEIRSRVRSKLEGLKPL